MMFQNTATSVEPVQLLFAGALQRGCWGVTSLYNAQRLYFLTLLLMNGLALDIQNLLPMSFNCQRVTAHEVLVI
jgi:hypothetical protein